MGKKRKRSKKSYQPNSQEPEELKLAPHSFVLHRGKVTKSVASLTRDFRKVMEPFTATSLKFHKKNVIKDFVMVASQLHVSHFCVFTSTDIGAYMKIVRFPQGPTLTFWIRNFSIARDVISINKTQYVFGKLFKYSPLIVLNGFSGEGHQLNLMASMFQNMFPIINIAKVRLRKILRCVLVNYNKDSKLIDFRHYAIRAVPVGLSKGVKKLVQNKVPNLGQFEDISEFIMKSGQLSESEAEDDEKTHVTLPQKLASRGNAAASQSAIRLFELGPRLTLQLMKIEDGVMNGTVLYHDTVIKTEEEKLLLLRRREQKRKLKETRKRIQEEHVKEKMRKKEELKEKSLKGMKKSTNEVEMQKTSADTNEEEENDADDYRDDHDDDDNEDDDVEWYRQEVGQEPEKGLFDPVQRKRKQMEGGPEQKRKKVTFKHPESRTDSFPRTQNKFGMKKNKKSCTSQKNNFKHPGTKTDSFPRMKSKFARKNHKNSDTNQKSHFNKKKVFGSKISKKRS